ncbi:unnamed protein product [Ascophyllum nodosum]
MFSGCQDSQTSADVQDVSKFGLPNSDGSGGACTNALLLTLANNEVNSWLSVLKGMQHTLKAKRFTQVPQLSASRPIDVNDPFYLSNPEGSGAKKSLLIGINYIGQQGELRGCHNDVMVMREYIATHGYRMDPDSCLVMMDDGKHATPDHQGVLDGFRWLVAGATAGDSLFMHYSGHGGSVKDTSGDEADNMDETLVPVDYRRTGQITDDVILKELVMVLPEGVTLTVVMDCCHSGSILDLPYTIKADEGTISSVEAGESSSLLGLNPNFDIMKMIRAARDIYAMVKSGDMDIMKIGKIAKVALS